MDNWEEKLEAMAEATMNENVTNIAGVPSWTLLLLQKICAKKGVTSIHDAWPNLELYMHGGISFLPYKSQFEALFTQPVHFMETYNASEGFFGIQDRKDADDMLLMLDYGIFYEFIPMDQLQKEHPLTLGLGEVEIGPSYAVVISTNGGLWRYLIGDTIRFTSIQPFRIKITGRTKQYINIAGEELMVENAEQALHQTCTKHQCSINDYTVGPIMESGEQIAHHHWIIEFNIPPQDLALFEMDLDLELRKTNSDYDAKRKGNLNLNPLHIMPVDQLTFLNWMKQRGKLGGQNKVPRLHPNPQYIHELQRFIQPS